LQIWSPVLKHNHQTLAQSPLADSRFLERVASIGLNWGSEVVEVSTSLAKTMLEIGSTEVASPVGIGMVSAVVVRVLGCLKHSHQTLLQARLLDSISLETTTVGAAVIRPRRVKRAANRVRSWNFIVAFEVKVELVYSCDWE